MMNSFWWDSNDSGQRKILWLSLNRMCVARESYGMGFRNLSAINLPMLGK